MEEKFEKYMDKQVKTTDQTIDDRGRIKSEGIEGRVVGVGKLMTIKHLKIKQVTGKNIRGYRYIYAKPEEVEIVNEGEKDE